MRLLSLLLLLGCPPLKHARPDADGDGFDVDTDCDDQDASVAPSGAELCDGLDNDCNGAIDDGATDAALRFLDQDGDGYGNPATAAQVCPEEVGYADTGGDCDDADLAVSPGASETCNGLDDDCDGDTDEADALDAVTTWTDVDADGYGAGVPTTSCAPPAGAAIQSGDCDDEDASRYPDALDECDGIDQDCDGEADNDATFSTWYGDGDGDGYGDDRPTLESCDAPDGWVTVPGDCDDDNERVGPTAIEVCDGQDNDCNGIADDGALGALTVWPDLDGDGFGDASAPSAIVCEETPGLVENNDDCDDQSALAAPGGIESCDGLDNDCNGLVDDGAAGLLTVWPDLDDDGFGDATAPASTTCELGEDQAENDDDCDDTTALAAPGQAEVCDGYDNDCDGTADVGVPDPPTWYTDDDGDGFGLSGPGTVVCAPPPGTSTLDGDCDDTDAAINPGALELCDAANTDEDCDGAADDDDSDTADRTSWYADLDGDGFGAGAERVACDALAGEVAVGGDCDDTTTEQSPGNAEVCDGAVSETALDEDCDGLADDDDPDVTGTTTWFVDGDGDSWGLTAGSLARCLQPAATTTRPGDCDDTNSAVLPGGIEVCGGTDEDCDTLTDDADPNVTGTTTWYADADADGWGDDAARVEACLAPSGYVGLASDCDDADAGTRPDGVEVCGGADEDCDGLADDDDQNPAGTSTFYVDADADGWGSTTTVLACVLPAGASTIASDCDDGRADVHPGATEVCDADTDGDTDEDCDGLADDADPSATGQTAWYTDVDADDFGVGAATFACTVGGASANSTDCDDGNPGIYPGHVELCNGIDDDCDPSVTEDGAVTLNGVGAFATIQEAITAASSGSTVQICAGTYTENLLVSGSVTLSGSVALSTGAGPVILDGGAAGPTLEVASGTVTLYDLTLQGGSGRDYDSDTRSEGGNILLLGGDLTLDRVLVQDGSASEGGGIAAMGGSLTVRDSDVVNNGAITVGGGVLVATLGAASFERVVFQDNTCTSSGGGLLVNASASADLVDVSFIGNNANLGGGAFVDDYGVLTASTTSWSDNTGSSGAGLYLDSYSDLIGDTLDFDTNIASNRGGAIYAYYADLIVSSSGFVANGARDGAGAYAYAGTSSFTDTSFTSSAAGQRGGAFYADVNHDLDLVACTVSGGTAFNGSGAYVADSAYLVDTGTLWSSNSASLGAVFYVASYGDMELHSSTVTANTGTLGGAMFLESYAEVDMYGGRLDGNVAASLGGGTYLRDYARFYTTSTDLGGSTYADNSPSDVYATYGGGGSYNWTGLTSLYCYNGC